MPEPPPPPPQPALLEIYASVLSIYERSFPSSTLDRAKTHADIAFECQDAGLLEDALKHFRDSLALQIEALGEKNEDVAQTRLSVAIVLEMKGRFQEALEVLPSTHPSSRASPTLVFAATAHRASLLASLGRSAEALDAYSRCLKISSQLPRRPRPSAGDHTKFQHHMAAILHDMENLRGESDACRSGRILPHSRPNRRRIPPLSKRPPSGPPTRSARSICRAGSSNGPSSRLGASTLTGSTLSCSSVSSLPSSEDASSFREPLSSFRRRLLSSSTCPSLSRSSSSHSLLSTSSRSRLSGAQSASGNGSNVCRGGPIRERPTLGQRGGPLPSSRDGPLTSAIKRAKLQRCEGGTRLVTRTRLSGDTHL
ncbi:hypothetical protein T484DRAFT_1826143 [Baffinella frigidus]|nr:hypothetical protein T484DRAFT_1826143 [Cryptophyta sp. CCMP2293]